MLDKDEKRSKFPIPDMNTVLSSLADDGDIGYILEVDLEYPKALHASHDDYPLTPESLEISNMLSPLQMAKFPNEPPQLKLTPNFRDKSRCVVQCGIMVDVCKYARCYSHIIYLFIHYIYCYI